MNNKHLYNRHLGKCFSVIGAGSSLKKYRDAIGTHIKESDISIGINVMSHMFVPSYHLWTNKVHYAEHGKCIQSTISPIFGCNVSEKLIRKHWSGDFVRINYDSSLKKSSQFSIDKNCVIHGGCRTAGNLAIVISHLMGAKEIKVFGMDGYTFYSLDQLNKGDSQHCYGKGKNDDYSWAECKKKDEDIYAWLKSIAASGIKFSIVTPTIYKEFYSGEIQ